MKEDFLQSLEFKGFTARIKRLSDSLMSDGKSIYNQSDLEIEPNWHIILLLLKQEKELTVTEIAKKLSFSHPGIIKITQKMKEKGYLNSKTDSTDSRKMLLSLSQKSLKQFPEFEKKWDSIQEIIEGTVGIGFLKKLTLLENKLMDGSISERYFVKKKDNG